MLWPHTKTPVPAEAGYELLFEMLDIFTCEEQSFHHNSLLYPENRIIMSAGIQKSTDARWRRHKLYHYYLYQIDCFAVNEKIYKWP